MKHIGKCERNYMGGKIDFTRIEENERTRDNVIKKLKDDGLPVVIYGAGKFAKFAAIYLKENNIPVLCFLDQERYWTPEKTIVIEGESIRCLNDALFEKESVEYNVLLGVIDYYLLDGLKRRFRNCHYVEYLDAVPAYHMTKAFLSEHSDDLKRLYDALEDKKSGDVLEAYCYARYTGDVRPLCELKESSEWLYDWKLLNISVEDVIVDGGSFVGDSITEIKDYLKGLLPQKIFAFEPDERNTKKLREIFSLEEEGKICIIPSGIYSVDGIMQFSNTGTQSSSVSDNGEISISVQALDEHKEYHDVTVIKMDIEGSELEALHGCKALLKRNKPRLAVCVYHNNEDIITIYEFLKQFGYRFYLRQHSMSSTETVLYAI